jgi:hypothetical protein
MKIIKWLFIALLMFLMSYAALIAFAYTPMALIEIDQVDSN